MIFLICAVMLLIAMGIASTPLKPNISKNDYVLAYVALALVTVFCLAYSYR